MLLGRLRLLGEFRLTPGANPHAGPLEVPAPHTQALLAYLALHGGTPVDRRRLAFVLWPDTAESDALRQLRQQLHRVRQILHRIGLPDAALTTRASQVCLQPGAGLWIDAREFRRQASDERWQIEAIEMYTGDLLPGLMAEWVLPLRAELRELYLEALRQQIARAKLQRNYPQAVHFARRLLQANALRESSHRLYIEALFLNGQRTEALRQYGHLAELLQQHFGARPMPETIALYEQVRAGNLSRNGQPLPAAAVHVPGESRHWSDGAHGLTGQPRGLAALDEALAAALRRAGRFVLLQVEAGVGKPGRLWTWHQAHSDELLAYWARGEQVEPTGKAGPSEQPAVIIDALRQGPAQIPWTAIPEHFVLGRLCRACLEGESQQSVPIEQWGQFILTLAARAPAAIGLLLEDVHNAEPATWQLLAFLARRCAAVPLLIAATCDPRHLGPVGRQVLRSLLARRQVEVVALQPQQPPHRSSTRPEGPTPQPHLAGLSRELLYQAARTAPAITFTVLARLAQTTDEEQILACLEEWLRLGLVREAQAGYALTEVGRRWLQGQTAH